MATFTGIRTGRRGDDYNKQLKILGLTQHRINRALDFLTSVRLVDEKLGYPARDIETGRIIRDSGLGRMSEYRFKDALQFKNNNMTLVELLQLAAIYTSGVKNYVTTPCVFKDNNKKIKLKADRDILYLNQNLPKILQYQRVFSDANKVGGGRLYNSFTNVPKVTREKILEKTGYTSIDITAAGVNLAFTALGLKPIDIHTELCNALHLPVAEYRDTLKFIPMAMLCSESIASTKQAIYNRLFPETGETYIKHIDGKPVKKKKRVDGVWQDTDENRVKAVRDYSLLNVLSKEFGSWFRVDDIYSKALLILKPIEQFLHKGLSASFQRIESEWTIAMGLYLKKLGLIPILIHDEILVPVEFEDKVRAESNRVWKSIIRKNRWRLDEALAKSIDTKSSKKELLAKKVLDKKLLAKELLAKELLEKKIIFTLPDRRGLPPLQESIQKIQSIKRLIYDELFEQNLIYDMYSSAVVRKIVNQKRLELGLSKVDSLREFSPLISNYPINRDGKRFQKQHPRDGPD